MVSKSKAIKNLFYLIKPQRKTLIIFTLVIILAALFEALGIGALYAIITVLESEAKSSIGVNYINSLLHLNFGKAQFMLFLFAGAFIFFLIRGVFIYFSCYYQNRVSEKIRAGLQIKIFTNYLSQKYDYFIMHKTGDLIQRQMMHTESAANAVVFSCKIAQNLFTAVVLYAGLFMINRIGTLISTSVMILIILFYLALSRAKIYVASQRHSQLQERAFSIVTEVITGIRQVKAFLAEEFFKTRFDRSVNEKARIHTRNATLSQAPAPAMQTVVLLIILSVLYFVNRAGGSFSLTVLFGGATFRIISSIAGINSSFMQLEHLFPSINIVSDLLRLEPSYKELPGIGRFRNNIEFENVDFMYSRKGFRLSDINIKFEKGKFYGIVGPSGSGKSTLIDLIMGFYSTENGRILIDGKDIKTIDIHSWLRQIGLISQATFIFNGTIEENISFAVDSSKIDKDKVTIAARIADLHHFIIKLPAGYKTLVGERGLTLSGGQRQRLAIARTVYREPEIYLFDEATSSLDTFSEKTIQQSIEDLSQSKTVISVAHRISSVINADEILVIKDGRVIEKGSHAELLSKKGFYAELYTYQYDIQHSKKEKEKENNIVIS